ncbi:MAG: DNA polymerase III subunit alpha [bacterium]|nr:DNA polymerase III subunit alpha [bacterium]
MSKSKFVHLHLHTEYSLLDGAIRICDVKGKSADLFKVAHQHGMDAIAMTDHGCMYGTIEFYQTCMKEGIKPIIGAEVYVAPKSRFDKKDTRKNSSYHLVLLAENEIGYKNLMKLVSIGFLEGFYYKPRIDKEVLKQYSEGLIALSSCMKGEVPQALLNKNQRYAEELTEKYIDIFGKDNFFIELQDNGVDGQKELNKELYQVAQKFGLGCVATNDAHYVNKEDAYIQEILLCIGTAKTLNDPNRMKFASDEFYFKSAEQMAEIFKEYDGAIENTVKIAERCNVEIDFSKMYLPEYQVPEGFDENTYLLHLCEEGIKERYKEINKEVRSRLDHEYKIIAQMGFSAYFLIVYDFIKYAREQGIPVGPGRGSGAGSIVAYLLKITDVCPLEYGLIFERFLNPSRISMPDLDIDFADSGREQVIDYVRNKYGEKNVAQIVTFGSMQARLALRDVGRVMDIPLKDVDKLAKLIPTGSTLYEATQEVADLKKILKEDERLSDLFDISKKIEGIKRHIGVHAAGLLISKDDMTNHVPFAKSSKNIITTQYEGNSLVSLGLLKMDFLGLKNLTIIDNAMQLIKKYRGISFDIDNVELDDKKTYKLLSKGYAVGVFQMESTGMRDLLRKLRPENIEDIIALIALYRPGPMGSGMLDDFVLRKHGKREIKYDHPLLEGILKETYGVILYQEQVMCMSTVLAGFSAAQADNLRKAMGKKIPEIIEKERENFITGAIKNNVDEKIADSIFENIVKFGGYGFNKSHSTAYGMVSYRTAYLKANYPVEYMCSLLNNEIGNNDKVAFYVSECNSMGIEILPPDIKRSKALFSVEDLENKKIRFALTAIKNVGSSPAVAIEEAANKHEFKSFTDMLRRVKPNSLNKKAIENLAKAGAFDCMGYQRAQVIAGAEPILASINRSNKDVGAGQFSLFDSMAEEEETINDLAKCEEWTDHEFLKNEKEVIGFYFSGHPLTNIAKEIKSFSKLNLKAIDVSYANSEIQLVCLITHVRRLKTKKGKEMAFLNIEDLTDEREVVVFPCPFLKYAANLVEDKIVLLTGKVELKDEQNISILANSIIPFADAKTDMIKSCDLAINPIGLEYGKLEELKDKFLNNIGACEVVLNLTSMHHGNVRVKVKPRIAMTVEIENYLKEEFGEDSITYSV